MADGYFDDLVVYGTLRVASETGSLVYANGVLTVTTPAATLTFGHGHGNELVLRGGTPDACKVRLEGLPGVMHAISFNDVVNGNAEEHTLIGARSDEEDPTSLGGQLMEFIRFRHKDGDAAMKRFRVVTAAYGTTDCPTEYTYPNLGPFTEPGTVPPSPVTPSAIVALTNLAGTLAAVQTIGDGQWLTTPDVRLDAACEVDLPLAGHRQIEIEARQAGGGTPPYVYVFVNTDLVIDGARPTTATVLTAALPTSTGPARVRILGAAQGGTLEIGGIRAV